MGQGDPRREHQAGIEHDREKPVPRPDPGCPPVFAKDHAHIKSSSNTTWAAAFAVAHVTLALLCSTRRLPAGLARARVLELNGAVHILLDETVSGRRHDAMMGTRAARPPLWESPHAKIFAPARCGELRTQGREGRITVTVDLSDQTMKID
jgi:hypothetical protein